MIRFLQFSDVHLGSPFAALGPTRAQIRAAELREAFCRCLALAEQKKCDLVLIPGDLFDSDYADAADVKTVAAEFAKYPDIPIFIAPGNHDRAGAKGIYDSYNFSDNVTVFAKSEIERIDIPQKNLCVFGRASVRGADDQASPLRGAPRAVEGAVNIALLHSLVSGSAGSMYAPVAKDEIAASGFSYIAFGHVHAFSGLQRAGGTYYAYAGCPEPRGYDEPGGKYAIVGELEGSVCTIEKIRINRREVHIFDVDCTGLATSEAIAKVCMQCASGISQDDIVRFVLKGELEEDANVSCGAVAALCGGFFDLSVKNETTRAISFDRYKDSGSLIAVALRAAQQAKENAQSGEEKEKAELAARLLYDALSGRRISPLD